MYVRWWWGIANWIHLVLDRNQWRIPVLKLRVSHKAVNFFMLLVLDYWILMNNVMNGFCQVTLP
jgi:hypothetical protein